MAGHPLCTNVRRKSATLTAVASIRSTGGIGFGVGVGTTAPGEEETAGGEVPCAAAVAIAEEHAAVAAAVAVAAAENRKLRYQIATLERAAGSPQR